jgi:hypothetical protein
MGSNGGYRNMIERHSPSVYPAAISFLSSLASVSSSNAAILLSPQPQSPPHTNRRLRTEPKKIENRQFKLRELDALCKGTWSKRHSNGAGCSETYSVGCWMMAGARSTDRVVIGGFSRQLATLGEQGGEFIGARISHSPRSSAYFPLDPKSRSVAVSLILCNAGHRTPILVLLDRSERDALSTSIFPPLFDAALLHGKCPLLSPPTKLRIVRWAYVCV